MKLTSNVSVLRCVATRAIAAATLVLVGCTTLPVEQKYSAFQLLKKKNEEMPRCVKEQCELRKDGSLLGCRTTEPLPHMIKDGDACEREFQAWKERIANWSDALEQRYRNDAARAPACIRERQVPRKLLELLGLKVDTPDAMAEALARGAFVPVNDPLCTAQICRWRTQVEPNDESPYCKITSANLAARYNLEAQADAER